MNAWAELVAAAAPRCRDGGCERPVVRVEHRWRLNGDGDWVIAASVMVCAAGHRVQVELLGASDA